MHCQAQWHTVLKNGFYEWALQDDYFSDMHVRLTLHEDLAIML